MVEANLLLANSAETDQGGLVHALGIGWNQTVTPTPPIALILLIDVPWDQTNQPHAFTLRLIDEDGQPAMLGQDEAGNAAPLIIGGDFEVGRPPGIKPGTTMPVSQAMNFGPGMPLTPGMTYQWRLEVNDEPVATRSFLVRPQQS